MFKLFFRFFLFRFFFFISSVILDYFVIFLEVAWSRYFWNIDYLSLDRLAYNVHWDKKIILFTFSNVILYFIQSLLLDINESLCQESKLLESRLVFNKKVTMNNMLFFFVYFQGLYADINERESDKCITQLFGTWPGPNKGHSCVVTEDCKQKESSSHKKGYALTHQYLYFLAGIKFGL